MPIKLPVLPLFAALLGLLGACSGKPGAEPARIVRLDREIAADSVGPDARAWLQLVAADQSAAVSAFQPEVEARLGSLDSVEAVLGHALEATGDTAARLFGVIIPYDQSVITGPDDAVYIGLNHYLGADAPLYRGHFPDYVLARKALWRLPSDVMEARIASKHPSGLKDDAPLLHHLLWQGAVLLNVLESMPDGTSEATVLAMSPEDYAWCREYEGRIWSTLIERQLLYGTDPAVAQRLLYQQAPATLINANAPVGTARFVALQLAKAYIDKTNSTPSSLLSPQFYTSNQSLITSQYSPANAR